MKTLDHCSLKSVAPRGVLAVLAALALAGPARADITLFQNEAFGGGKLSTDLPINDLSCMGLNDRASSLIVTGERWEVCENRGFGGRCVVLRPGRYASLKTMGLNDRLSSARALGRNPRADNDRSPELYPARSFARREAEQLYEAEVISVRAVVGPPERRCWVERERFVQSRPPEANAPNAMVGAVLGGILGHQLGGSGNRTAGTVGGAAIGAAVGANIDPGPSGEQTAMRDVQRCSVTPTSAPPAFWDVSYRFRGEDHQVQLTSPPGPTVTVNRLGEPRE
jgi:uncharacterized protein YcfJ